MRKFFLFIIPILIIITAVFTAYGVVQVRSLKEKLVDDLKRKARVVAESMELSVKDILLTNNVQNAQYLTEKFQQSGKGQGCVIYGRDGAVFAVNDLYSGWRNKHKPYIKDVLNNPVPRGGLELFKGLTVYSYVLPVHGDGKSIVGLIEVLQDTSYVFTRLSEVWKKISASLAILLVLVIAVVALIQRHLFFLPIQRLTDWFHQFRKGETDKLKPFVARDELGRLASEVEQVALDMRVARRTVAREAQSRLQKEDVWTELKLKNLINAKLGENALFVVSNREPYMHVSDQPGGPVQCVRPAGGVVAAIDPILKACGGTWVAQGSGNADKQFVNSENKLGVPPEDNRYILKRVWLTPEEEEGYYYGFANEGLWPLCHITHTRPIFREADWLMYQKVNQKFADAVLEELPQKSSFVFIQDYHFTLMAGMIKKQRPDTTVALFWHIPWPNAEVFSICPYQKEIIDGMLSCDLIGFHVQFHCNNFMDTVNRLLECRINWEKHSVVRANRETYVRPFPISVDPLMNDKSAGNPKSADYVKTFYDLEGRTIFLGVERIDYTKGIIERILAIDRFLEKYPEYKDKFVFVQLGAPSRTLIKKYQDLIDEIDTLVEKINVKHGTAAFKPIIYLKRQFSIEEVIPFYLTADVCVVSSLHDGMNLVAKEYVSAKSDLDGMLILSCFTGASKELTDAIPVNPYSTEEFADAFKQAMDMPPEERRQRMQKMRAIIKENNVYRWAGNIITELTSLNLKTENNGALAESLHHQEGR